tara:strand:- start:53 stop:739 length:687 start_codon:yes stop_codon:yes gene_type:complete
MLLRLKYITKKYKMRVLSILTFSILLLSCYDESCYSAIEPIIEQDSVLVPIEKIDYGKLPFKNENGNITAVIEIPAGTNGKFEYNYKSKKFIQEIREGKPRVIKFLPYLGSYGFIPGTYMDPAIGGDGDALDILIIGEAIKQGTILEIKPIATLRLLDGDEEDHKVIGVPIDPQLNITNINDYKSLSEPIKEIIKTWFLNYKGPNKIKFKGWIGTDSTNNEIKKWVKK